MVFDRNGTLTWEHTLDLFPTGAVTRMEFSSDGSELAVVANDRVLEYFVTVPEEMEMEETPAPEVNATEKGELTSPGKNVSEPEELTPSPMTNTNESKETIQGNTYGSAENMLSQVMTDAVPSGPVETQEGTFFGLYPFPWKITFPKLW